MHLCGQPPIDRSLLALHPSPLIAVVLEVPPVVLLALHPSGQSPDRSNGPAGPGAFATPHIEGRKEEHEETRSEQVRANTLLVM